VQAALAGATRSNNCRFSEGRYCDVMADVPGGRIVSAAGTIVAFRVLDRLTRINLRAFPTKRTVSGSPPGPSAFIGD
jgi:hypothetical protein